MSDVKISASYYRVIAIPFTDGDATSTKTRKTTVLAWGSRNAVTLACQKMDIHPKNYQFSTDHLAERMGEKTEHVPSESKFNGQCEHGIAIGRSCEKCGRVQL